MKVLNICIREPNFEALRIVSMSMVVTLHALGYGGILNSYAFGTAGDIVFWSVETLCYVAVNCFVLISGYFMVTQNLKALRIIKFIVQIEFYSILCMLTAWKLFGVEISMDELMKCIFPLTGWQWWFASTYVVLLLLSPILNSTIRHLTRKQHIGVCVLLLLIYSVLPTVFFWSRTRLSDGYDVAWFIVLYFIAAYIRLYEIDISVRKCLTGYLILSGGGILSRIIIGMIMNHFFGSLRGKEVLYIYNSLLMTASSVLIFIAFKKMKFKNKKLVSIVNGIAPYVFGAYLWHEHSMIRDVLWERVAVTRYIENGILSTFFYMLLVVVGILLIGCVLEKMRLCLMKLLGADRFYRSMDEKFEHMLGKIVFDEKDIVNGN